MGERLAWAVIFSWLVLAWVQAQLPDAPPPKTPATQTAASPSPALLPAATPVPTPQVAEKPVPSTAPEPPQAATSAPTSIPSGHEELAQLAQKETNPYLKATLYLQAQEILAQRQGSEAVRSEYFSKAMTDAQESPLAAEACIGYLDMVLDRPNPGHPTQLVDRLTTLIKKHGIGPGMIDAARVQHIIGRLQTQYTSEAKKLQALLDAPQAPLAQANAQSADAAPESAKTPPPPATAIERALLLKNPLRFEALVPDPGKTLPIKLTRKNPSTLTVTETLTWEVPQGSAWTPQPATQTVTYLPGQSVDVTFDLAVSPRPDAAYALTPQVTSSFTVQGSDKPIAQRSAALRVDMARYYQKLMIAYATRVSSPPIIDGKLDDSAWAGCLPVTHFIKYDGTEKLPYPTDIRVAWDDQAMYVMARINEPDLAGLWTKASTRNGDVWTDDSLEVFFDFDPITRGFVQFIVSANNTPYDANANKLRWDTLWTSQTGREKDAWTLEMSLPWRALETPVPKVGDKIGFQLVRNRVRPNGDQTAHSFWQWSPTFAHSNLVPNRFGTLVFTAGPPGSATTTGIIGASNPSVSSGR